MTIDEAMKRVAILDNGNGELREFRYFIYFNPGDDKVQLNGWLTANELIAIAAHMEKNKKP